MIPVGEWACRVRRIAALQPAFGEDRVHADIPGVERQFRSLLDVVSYPNPHRSLAFGERLRCYGVMGWWIRARWRELAKNLLLRG